ncbi:MAG: hypothetical protein B6245_10730 [Desulfobacteraceae bacterium 4572_88]|nr:MAG: hypothetical protein B6245_10730 [Desulfobacteraceae bacterium 4572_88]
MISFKCKLSELSSRKPADVITAEGTEKARRTQRIIICDSALSVPSSRSPRLKKLKKVTLISFSTRKMLMK